MISLIHKWYDDFAYAVNKAKDRFRPRLSPRSIGLARRVREKVKLSYDLYVANDEGWREKLPSRASLLAVEIVTGGSR